MSLQNSVFLIQSTTTQLLNLAQEKFEQPQVQNGLALIGLAWATKYVLSRALKAVNAARIYLLPQIFQRTQNWRELGQWAVVTGSTDGIGKEFARQLAAQGLNIILISRNPEKLKNVAEEIMRDFNVKTKTIPINFTDALPATYRALEKQLRDYDIGLLVNNVGVYVPYPMPFEQLEEDNIWDHVVVNCGSATMMIRILLPQMKQRKRGGIINVSSAAATYPIPLVNSYSSSKVYMDYLTESLRRENEKSGIHFLNLNPFYVVTNMTKFSARFKEPTLFVVSAENFVMGALRAFGRVDRTAGCFSHAVQRGIFEITPCGFRWLVDAAQNLLWKEGKEIDEKTE